jgi:hypothetical protein
MFGIHFITVSRVIIEGLLMFSSHHGYQERGIIRPNRWPMDSEYGEALLMDIVFGGKTWVPGQNPRWYQHRPYWGTGRCLDKLQM